MYHEADLGNYHCEPGSPAIDSADNVMVPAGIISDLDGIPRFQDDPEMPDTGNPDGVNPIVVMGAYEFRAPGPLPIPTLSEWGMCTMTLLMLTAGTIVYGQRCPTYGS